MSIILNTKLNTKQKFESQTRDLMWDPKDFDMNKIYPLIEKEGIILKDPKNGRIRFALPIINTSKFNRKRIQSIMLSQMLLKPIMDMPK